MAAAAFLACLGYGAWLGGWLPVAGALVPAVPGLALNLFAKRMDRFSSRFPIDLNEPAAVVIGWGLFIVAFLFSSLLFLLQRATLAP